MCIMNAGRMFRTQCLNLVAFGHFTTTTLKQGFYMPQRLRVFNQRLLEGFGKGVAGNIIQSWAKPSRDQNKSLSFSGFLIDADHSSAVIGHRRMPLNRPSATFKFYA